MVYSAVRFYISLYLLVTGVYLITASGRIGLSDSVAMFNVAQSVAQNRSLSSEPCELDPNNLDAGSSVGCVPGARGGHYAGYGLVPSLLVVPVILGAKAVSAMGYANALLISKVGASIFTVFVGGLACLVLARWILKLGYNRFTAVTGACIFAFASPFWNGSVGGFLSEPYFTLALLAAACLLSNPRRKSSCVLAGLAFGIACGTRINGVVLFPAFILCMAFYVRSYKLPVSRFVRDVVEFSVPFSVCVLLIAWANYARFGSPFKTGYHLAFPTLSILFSTPLFRGFFGLLFSPEVGLLVFAPWILVAVIFFPKFVREHLPEAILCGVSCLIYIIFFAKFFDWHGGTVAGPRLLIPLLPFLVLMMVPAIQYLQQGAAIKPRRWVVISTLMAALFGVAFVIQLLGTIFPVDRYYTLSEFYKNRPQKPWWSGSIPFASADFLSRMSVSKGQMAQLDPLVARQIAQSALASSNSAATEQEFLEHFPNSANMMAPNLVWLKVRLMGQSFKTGIAYLVAAIAMAFAGAIGLMRFVPRNGNN
jgi:hypothetical protein